MFWASGLLVTGGQSQYGCHVIPVQLGLPTTTALHLVRTQALSPGLVTVMGNLWVRKINPYLYPSKRLPGLTGRGFDRYGKALNDLRKMLHDTCLTMRGVKLVACHLSW